MLTADQDKAIVAIMDREGYAAVESVDTGSQTYVAIKDCDGDGPLHFVRQDGAEIDLPTDQGIVVLGYPAHEVAS